MFVGVFYLSPDTVPVTDRLCVLGLEAMALSSEPEHLLKEAVCSLLSLVRDNDGWGVIPEIGRLFVH